MKLRILTILKLTGTTGTPETALRMEIEMRYRIRVGDMEFTSALADLVAGGHITSETDDLTGDRIWKVTTK